MLATSPPSNPPTPAGLPAHATTSRQEDQWLAYLVSQSKKVGGAWSVPDQLWKEFLAATGQPAGLDALDPLTGHYAGESFAPSKEIVQPGLPALAATASGLLPNVSFLGVLGDLTLWKGVGLVLAGGLVLVFAALELRRL